MTLLDSLLSPLRREAERLSLGAEVRSVGHGFVSWLRHTHPGAWSAPLATPTMPFEHTELRNSPALATTGFLIAAGLAIETDLWLDARRRLTSRQPPRHNEFFLFRPLELLGVALGVSAMREKDPEGLEALASLLQLEHRRIQGIERQRFRRCHTLAVQQLGLADEFALPVETRSTDLVSAAWQALVRGGEGQAWDPQVLVESIRSGVEVKDAEDAAVVVIAVDSICRLAASGLGAAPASTVNVHGGVVQLNTQGPGSAATLLAGRSDSK